MGITELFTKRAEWIPFEYVKEYEGGGSIRVRGHKCSACDFFRHIKNGTSPYCENCGATMNKKKEEAA